MTNVSIVASQLESFTEITDSRILNSNLAMLARTDQSNVINRIALGLTYHEICVLYYLNMKDKSYSGYAVKAYRLLLNARTNTPESVVPLLDSYINSSRSLIAAVKSNPFLLIKVIRDYDKLIMKYGDISYHPEFLQASLIENLPNIFGLHAKALRRFKNVISKKEADNLYTTDKIVSFCYLSLGKLTNNTALKKEYWMDSIQFDKHGDGGGNMAAKLLESIDE